MAIFIYSCITGRTPPRSFRKLVSCAFTSTHALNSVSEYRKQKSLRPDPQLKIELFSFNPYRDVF